MTNTPPIMPVKTKDEKLETNEQNFGIQSVKLSKEIKLNYRLKLILNRSIFIGAKVIEAEKSDKKKTKKKLKELKFYSYGVPLGSLAVVTRSDAAFDHDGIAEVYLGGERIVRRKVREEKEWRVIEIAANPGFISMDFLKRIDSIENNQPSFLKANFTFQVYTEDPIRLLNMNPHWDNEIGSETIISDVIELTKSTINNFLDNDTTKIWSEDDINSVANNLRVLIDNKLQPWGLRIRTDFMAEREIPDWFYDFIFSCISYEKKIIKSNGNLANGVKFAPDEVVEIKTISDTRGLGSGFFELLNNNDNFGDRILAIREYIPIKNYLKMKNLTSERELSLIIQIISTKLISPRICEGEWLEKKIR